MTEGFELGLVQEQILNGAEKGIYCMIFVLQK